LKSIQRSLSLGLIAGLLVITLLLVQTSLWLFEAGLKRSLENDLREETEGLLIAIVKGPDGIKLDTQRLNPRYQRPFSGHYFRIELPDRTWRSRSLWDAVPAWPETSGLAAELLEGPQRQRLLAFSAEYRRDGQPIVISVAQDYTPILDSFARVRLSGLGLVGVALLVFLLLQRYAMTLALRPLERARQQIAQLQQGQRQQLDSQAPVELQPLVAQINHLLAQTEALANGQGSEDPHREYPGGRPSTLILLDALTPQSLGALIAMYEHAVYVQSLIWNINAFDQFGVELGKQLASQLLPALQGEAHAITDPVTLELLGRLTA